MKFYNGCSTKLHIYRHHHYHLFLPLNFPLPKQMHAHILQSIILFVLISCQRFCVSEEDEAFLNCNRFYNCGGNIRGVGYPFWGGDRPRVCGLDGFELRCHGNNYTSAVIGAKAFLVLGISNGDGSMRIASIDRFYESVSSVPDSAGSELMNNITVPVVRRALEEFRRNSTRTLQEVVNGSEVVDCAACDRSGGRCVLATANSTAAQITCHCRDGSRQFVVCPPSRTGGGLNLGLKFVIGVGAAAVGAFIMCMIFWVYFRQYKKRYASSSILSHGSSPYPSLSKDLEKAGVHVYDYHELKDATGSFDPKKALGDGGYGAVYKGKLQDGRVVAVKRLYENHYKRVEQFMNEVEILTRLRHQNLVSLYGCTSSHCQELLLVYEYIPNGTLADHLHGPHARPGSLSWITRLSIAIETASALTYLHASDVIHRDIKSTNILLDNNFTVKVADFGLSRLLPTDATHVSTAPQGTPGYVDPEYHEYYQVTEKSDVYSFGVVLIELISSKPAIDITRHQHEINLSTMAIKKIQSHALHELVDPHLAFQSDLKVRETITAVAELAFQCLQYGRDMRPCMQEVFSTLHELKSKDYNIDVMDIAADDILPLKSSSPPLSPNSVGADGETGP